MNLGRYWSLLRIGSLPLTDAQKDTLRLKEKRVGVWGGLIFLICVFAVIRLELSRQLFSSIIPLLATGYVILTLQGAALILALVLIAASMVLIAVLPTELPSALLTAIPLVTIALLILGTALVGRLQFVRGSSQKLRKWPK